METDYERLALPLSTEGTKENEHMTFHCFPKTKKSLLKEKKNKTTIRYDNIS